jgi:non-reducing end alpha-L-arabinofuranosidase
MNAISLSVCAALGFIAGGCGGTTAIGEAGSDDVGGGGATGNGGNAIAGTGLGGSNTPAGAGSGGKDAPAGAGTSSGVATAALPCAVLQMAGLECVAAHSTVRVLVPGYTGSLYRAQRADGQVRDIGAVDGYADAQTHTEFCADVGCVIKIIYDQSSMGNDLTEAPPGSAKTTPAKPVDANALKVQIDGRNVYGMLFRPGQGYRKLIGNGTAVGDEPQTIYMVSSQHDLINGCCFDYGNAEKTANNDGNGNVEAVYLGMGVIWGSGVGPGPWVMADLENGLYPGWENGQDRNVSTNTSVTHDFVTAVLVGDTAEKNAGKGRFALYGGDATTGKLKTMYDGIRPEKPGYVPMQKQGSVILGVAGDNSDGDGGRFYEGVIANGAATDETVAALQSAIVEAGYGK